MPDVHPSSVIAPGARVAKDAVIGPFCAIGPEVSIGPGCRLLSHVVIDGCTTVGSGNTFYPFSSIGTAPQDLKYKGEKTRLEIGNDNQFREGVTVNTGTVQDNSLTRIGSNNLFMTSAHVAHDCIVGNHVVLANGATLAGHVQVGDHVIIGGLSAIHQFVRIGRHAIVGGMSGVERDISPFTTATGNRAHLDGLNLVGLRRRGFARESIHALQQAFSDIFLSDETNLAERARQAGVALADCAEVQELVAFIANSNRGLCLPRDAT